MPTARFFFDAGSGGVLWAVTPEDKRTWGYLVDLDRLPISPDLHDSLCRLIERYDTSLNWGYPPDPGPWREAECHNFNEAVRQALGRLRDELGPAWQIYDEFDALAEDPDLDRYLADPAGFVRI
ncbi:hypothetical protein CP981_31090 [Streptomyces platensis]|uniref:Uncharacterized protein n=1 Tax=Streptomyces platensis TaxID=58346 RepID=A0AAE6TQ12_STRPT|nr:hypothetical protein BG653_00755 [Streptomyces platensis]QEV55489.1 hypothetical protein CP981_31090 [Streptomyces platensis]